MRVIGWLENFFLFELLWRGWWIKRASAFKGRKRVDDDDKVSALVF